MFVGATSASGTAASAATGPVADMLRRSGPGAPHEAIPHGVPPNFAWHDHATVEQLAPPDAISTWQNIRGAVYVDESNVRASNTRVEIKKCESWGLDASTSVWRKYIDLSPDTTGEAVSGRPWKEDFTAPGLRELSDLRNEPDGGVSVINHDGFNYHYYSDTGRAPLVNVGRSFSGYVTGCSFRTVLADPTGPDNRAASRYIANVGNDWKGPNGECTTNSSGSTLCYAIGNSRFLRVTPTWRRVVFTTMTGQDVDTKPLPPQYPFLNPDGSFGD